MTLTKSLLLGSSATLVAVAGAQAADLPSKKAAPATYVKVCDAYGAGFFVIPGTDTCVKVGGYVRAEYQYVGGQDAYSLRLGTNKNTNFQGTSGVTTTAGSTSYHYVNGAQGATSSPPTWSQMTASVTNGTALAAYNIGAATLTTSGTSIGGFTMWKSEDDSAASTAGYEIRGRIDVDARTPTAMGPARTFVRLRLANTSGIRNTNISNNAPYSHGVASTTGASLESASIQWAGFTFGVAPENYAMMPSQFYNANPWAGFPNGMKQISYTARMGGGLSATLAIEDPNDFGYATNYRNGSSNAAVLVGNIRLDQSWGFAAVHGMVGNNSVQKNWTNVSFVAPALSSTGSDVTSGYWIINPFSGFNAPSNGSSISTGITTKTGWAVGSTINLKLPMIASGDQLWVTANYADGRLGALLSGGGLSNVNSAANKRLLGGLTRVDSNLMVTSSDTFDTVKGWNVAAAFTHYWSPNWRSNLSAGYVEVNPPKVRDASAGIQWGKGQLQVYTANVIYSPVRNLDIGLETQYAALKNQLQNWSSGAPITGLSPSNWTTKLRVERSF